MIDALVSGRLRGVPTFRTASNGAPFVAFRLVVPDRKGVSVLCSCISFSATVCEALRALNEGDGLAATGEACLTVWDGINGAQNQGLDMLVHGLLTAYHAGRKRKASEPASGGDGERGPM